MSNAGEKGEEEKQRKEKDSQGSERKDVRAYTDLPVAVLTLSSEAALSIITSGSRRPPGPGPIKDTTPLQSTVLLCLPW